LATVSIESAKLTATEESLYYKDAARLCRLYPRAFKTGDEAMPYTCNPQALGAKLYDGKWHGRGLIQLTWQDNYKRAAEALGRDYLANPDLVKEPSDASLTAAWFWHAQGQRAGDGSPERTGNPIHTRSCGAKELRGLLRLVDALT
jgi:putative chitinase